MSTAPLRTRQALVQLWIVQMIGTVVLLGIVYWFTKSGTVQFGTIPAAWKPYVFWVILATAAPAVLYLRHYKAILNQDIRLERQRGGSPDPAARTLLAKSLAIGSALCELPMAAGAVQLLMGGEMRYFLGATMVTIAVRLSYRPFTKTR